MVKCP